MDKSNYKTFVVGSLLILNILFSSTFFRVCAANRNLSTDRYVVVNRLGIPRPFWSGYRQV